ncbi:hypothetical protein GGX14DRAFT_462875 [Mycena pura]|uniref:Uncharacterized protein n=1 Tax=Mycena pura TaxID=153505 RepID=A0AAD6V455_9AGAR|nr:hypothetical protein GGX14DRAFT_462875 [Mycena pura]
MSCVYGSGGPPMNTDISGIGVRLSFYLQTVFLGCLSARSTSPEEVTGALYTLLATNTGMAVTALILGFKSMPEISFHDALVVFYLLYISWVTVFFSLPSSAIFPGKIKMVHWCSVIQSYTLFAFAFVMLSTAPRFGSTPECNPNAVVVIFRPFSALHGGRILFLVLTGLVVIVYTAILYNDYIASPIKRLVRRISHRVIERIPDQEQAPPSPAHPEPVRPKTPPARETTATVAPEPEVYDYVPPSKRQTKYRPNIDWKIVLKITVVLILWAMAVMNTELLIRWNRFAMSDDSHTPWQFGQVLPMFLVVLPLVSLVITFMENGFRKVPPKDDTLKFVISSV